jgi:hypothetical protein
MSHTPKMLHNKETGEIVTVTYIAAVNPHRIDHEWDLDYQDDVSKPGLYMIYADDPHYEYYDGKDWFEDGGRYEFIY